MYNTIQIIKIMTKYTLYMFIVNLVFMSAVVASEVNAQYKSVREVQISIYAKKSKIKDVFAEIETKTNFKFSYHKEDLAGLNPVNLEMANVTVAEILTEISREARLQFRQHNNNISISPLSDVRYASTVSQVVIEDIEISGKITDENGEGLPGASVVVKGSTVGTTTNIEGDYKFSAPADATLVISYVGYVTQEVLAGSRNVVDVQLDLDASQLEEIVVVGYGTQSKRNLTSAVSSISSKQIEEMPVVGVDQAIQGRAAGVVVTKQTGEPGGGVTIRVRGTTSIGSGNDPLYVIDGVPINNTQTSNVNIGEGRVNGMSHLNPSDIESIEILKDAAAASIYGARAANGVVLITTKRGKSGKGELSLDMYTGVSTITNRYDVLNASQFMEMTNEGLAQLGENPFYSTADISNPNYDTNWQDEIFRSAMLNNVNVSARGGNDNSQYMISGGVMSQEGTITDSKFTRYSFRANIDHKASDRINIGTNIYSSFMDQDRVKNDGGPFSGDASNFNHIYGEPALSTALVKNPAIPVFTEEGIYSWDQNQLSFGNPVRQAKEVDIVNNVTRVMGSVFADFKLSNNLSFKSRFSADLRLENEEWFDPSQIIVESLDNLAKSSRRTFDQSLWTFDNYLTYNFGINDHNFTVLAGSSAQKTNWESSFVLATGIEVNNIRTLNAGAEFDVVTSTEENWSLMSYFSRFNYDYQGKYLVTLNARYDGSSRFNDGNRWGFFPSASVGWRISDEAFLEASSVVSDLKLRASYGQTGNQEVGNFSRLSLFSIGGGTNRGNNYSNQTGATFSSLADPKLTWETTTQLDVGVDLSLFDERLSLGLDYYVKKTDDLLFRAPLPSQAGFSGLVTNIGEMQNKGWEVQISSVNINKDDFRWGTTLNISGNSNKVLSLLDDEDVIVSAGGGNSIARVGESIGFYLYEREQFVDPEEGTVVIVNQDGNVDSEGNDIINTDDLVWAGSPFPDFFGGLTNDISYKNFDLSVFLQFSSGNQIFNSTRRTMELLNVGGQNVFSANTTREAWENRWQAPGDVTEYPKLNWDQTGNTNNLAHNGFLEDGSYLRLKNVTLGYNFSSAFLDRLKISRARIYLTGNNMLTFTGYSGYDPEVDHFTGVNTGNNSGLLRGYDYGSYPQAKSYVLGLKVTL